MGRYHYKRAKYKSETIKILIRIKLITSDEGEFPFYTGTSSRTSSR